MCLALMMVVAAVASLNVALPDLARHTGATQTQLQWIVDAYSLAFAALLLPAGAIGDRIGRKPVLLTGLVIYGVASACALLVSSAGPLIALRVAMGIGAACIMPVTLSVITTIFPPEERGKAVGTWVGVAAGGGVLGLVSSGVLLEWLPWQSIFGLNVLLAAIAIVGTLVIVPATRDAHRPRLDPIGTVLSVVALVALVFGVIEAPDHGWTSPLTLATVGLGVAGIVAFVIWELNRRDPMLDPRNFMKRGFGAGSLSVTVQFFAMFGFMFVALPYLQLVMGFSPLRAAASLLPMALVVIPLSRVAPLIAARFGVRLVGASGLALMALGFLVLSSLSADSSYAHFLAGLLPFGAGMALSGSPATTAIVASLPVEKQGVASAVNDVSRELGGALGIAVLGSLLNAGYRSGFGDSIGTLPPGVAEQAKSSIASAEAIGHQIGPRGDALIAHAQTAFTHGLNTTMLAGAAMLILGAIFVLVRAPGREESRANAGGDRFGAVAPTTA
jgi:EmrB/QacA subfamily drug resistance transporter